MNEQNFEYLKNQLKYTGFGESLQDQLREKMESQTEEFSLVHKPAFGDIPVEVLLQFRKSEQSELYFFNRYLLQLKNEKGTEVFTQSFRIGRDNNITLKEAFNLMQGRAVHKDLVNREGEKYSAWLQLNFREVDDSGNFRIKQFHQHYGFDLEQSLSNYPIVEMEQEESARFLIRSLQRGNRHQITMRLEGREKKLFIEASPQYKSIHLFNEQMLRINLTASRKTDGSAASVPPTADQSEMQEKNNHHGEEEGEDQGAAGSRNRPGRKGRHIA